MKALTSLAVAVTATLSLALPKPATAAPGGFYAPAAAHGFSGHSSFGAHAGAPSFHAPVSGFHASAPGYHSSPGSRAPSMLFYTAPRSSAVQRSSGGVRTPTFAFGGHPTDPPAPAAAAAQRSRSGPAGPTGGWDRHRDRIWHGHHYHWNDGAWVIIDDGYYPWDDSYYVPVSPDVYPDTSYDYGGDTPSDPGAPTPPPPVPAGSASPTNSDSIAADVQQGLATRGYYDGPIDGVVGDGTRQGISDFQRDNHLPVTGYITKSLLNALGL
jgi:hypothetical protein